MRALSTPAPVLQIPARSFHVQKLHVEDERRVGRYLWPRDGAVAERGRDDELTTAADLHRRHALVPPLDDHALPQNELVGLPPVARAVELRPVGERPRVVDDRGLPRLRARPRADDEV